MDLREYRDVYEVDARLRLRFTAGSAKDSVVERERLRSYVERLNTFVKRKMGLEIEIVELGEPIYISCENKPLREAV